MRLTHFLTLLAAPLLFAASCATSAAEQKPVNVLLLMNDQHRGDWLGAAGAAWIQTPHLDRLAKEGARFTRAYASAPSCLPARASLLTGQRPWSHGSLGYTAIPSRYPHEMPRMFTDAGYRTHAVGKNHFSSNDKHGYESVVLEEAWKAAHEPNNPALHCDYRKWFAENHPDKVVDKTGLGYTDHRGGRYWPYEDELHATNWTADRAVDFLESYDGDQPWMLKVSFQRPHPPFDPTKAWVDVYEDVEIPMPKVGKWAEQWHGGAGGSLQQTPNATRGHFPDNEVRLSRRYYAAAISHVDEQLGKVIAALEARGELENTMILFCSDHGDMMGDNHLWRKTYAYEPSANIPLIIRWPASLGIEAKRGQVIDELVELRDVMPTLLDAAGLDRPDTLDGNTMLDLIRGENGHWRTVLDLEHSQIYWEGNSWVALTDRRYKYIYFTTLGRQQLFDLENDPQELADLARAPEHAELVRAWRGRMVEFLRERGQQWVKGDDLVVQRQAIVRGPNYPE